MFSGERLKRRAYLISVLLLCISLCACSAGADVIIQPTSTLNSEATRVQRTDAPLSTATLPILVPDQTLTPSASPTPTSTTTQTPTPTPLICWVQGGHYEYGDLRSDGLPLPLEYAVYLPPCYDQQPERRYPVLYLIHGQNYNNDQWDRLGADETADALIATGEIPPFIIVMPRDRSWAQPTEDNFGRALVEDLIPRIDNEYRTLPERDYRAVGGLSRGAGWAVHLGLSQWELFGAIGGHSLPVFWTDTYHIREWLDAIPLEKMPRIYLDIGEKDRPNILQSAIWFENLLTEKGIPHEWHLYSGYHEEAYWSAHLDQYLRWYTLNWTLDQ